MHRICRFTLQVTSMQDSTSVILFLYQTKLLVKCKKIWTLASTNLSFWSTWLSLSFSSYRKLGQSNNPTPSKDQAKHAQDFGLSRELSERSLQDFVKELSPSVLRHPWYVKNYHLSPESKTVLTTYKLWENCEKVTWAFSVVIMRSPNWKMYTSALWGAPGWLFSWLRRLFEQFISRYHCVSLCLPELFVLFTLNWDNFLSPLLLSSSISSKWAIKIG